MMHKYLRAIGFSKIKSRKEANALIKVAIHHATEKNYSSLDEDIMLAEYNYFISDNIGLCVRGEYDENFQFLYDYYVPFFRGRQVSSCGDITVERHTEKESYAGVCDDIRVGTSLIFYLQNVIGYLKIKNAGKLPIGGTSLSLSGLCVDGTVLLPLMKNESDLKKTRKISSTRANLIAKARQGDEEAIENLTLGDMDTYSNIQKLIVKEDILSLVDTYFMPYGVECDLYSILGEIVSAETAKNKVTNEELWILGIECNDIYLDLCINKEDLYGEPVPGRRFKGTIWLQGMIHFPK